MAPQIPSFRTSTKIPTSSTVVIIGGGIIGLTAALTLAERNIPVVVLEKGRVGAEQSSRNLGWIRKTNRAAEDVPLAIAADCLWAEMPERVGQQVGYRQSGIMFLARTQAQLFIYENWHKSIAHLELGSRLLTNSEIDNLVPGGQGHWVGGIFTPSDGCAEPTLACSAIAQAAIKKGVIIVENCAVRTLQRSGGKVSGVITEQGEIHCEQVLLAAGLWSRRFLGNMGIKFPTLPLICSVLRTKPMEGPTEIAVGAPDFSFCKHKNGGFVITQRGALDAPLSLDHLLIGLRYLSSLRQQRDNLHISLGKYFFKDLRLKRHWKGNSISPFERIRTMDPAPNLKLNEAALRNLKATWPVFETAEADIAWAGVMDITPDSNPVIDSIKEIPGLTIATGFSGHGFGTSPAAGQLAADLVSGATPIVDPKPYQFGRLSGK